MSNLQERSDVANADLKVGLVSWRGRPQKHQMVRIRGRSAVGRNAVRTDETRTLCGRYEGWIGTQEHTQGSGDEGRKCCAAGRMIWRVKEGKND